MQLSEKFRTTCPSYKYVCVGDGSFIIIDEGSGKEKILSLKLGHVGRETRCYSRIFNRLTDYDFETKSEEQDNKIVFVQEVFSKDLDITNYWDRVTYGIDSETLKIVTDIYSERQERRIPLYTDEQVSKIDINDIIPGFKNFSYQRCFHSNDLNGSYTLLNEVLKPLDQYIETHPVESAVMDSWGHIKESFVKSIGKKNN